MKNIFRAISVLLEDRLSGPKRVEEVSKV